MNSGILILSIDTSSDETSAAVTDGTAILSNIIWSQASLHAKWGGIVPSLAKRLHGERIDWVVEKAVQSSGTRVQDLDAIAVTVGPGLAIALEVGITKAKELALKWHKPLIPVNHLEGHIMSALAERSNSEFRIPRPRLGSAEGGQNSELTFPALALVVSGGHTELVLVSSFSLQPLALSPNYRLLAQTMDDALGEALDKAARMLGLGYPGGAVLEKLARDGNPSAYKLPLPLLGRENQGHFSFSGLKTAFYRLVNSQELDKQKIYDLAASFQNIAFEHLIRIIKKSLINYQARDLLVGGGVAANVELRKRLRKLGREKGLDAWFPYTKKLCTDNAAMIGLAAQFAFNRGEVAKTEEEVSSIDRQPNLKL